mmetsp:Transcript_94637/g.216483  ORF Transcript_94637/g.216483 Transcript_94637/m.216483 type:complete len:109 (-) Transcript_94637:1820-2146(-)
MQRRQGGSSSAEARCCAEWWVLIVAPLEDALGSLLGLELGSFPEATTWWADSVTRLGTSTAHLAVEETLSRTLSWRIFQETGSCWAVGASLARRHVLERVSMDEFVAQ